MLCTLAINGLATALRVLTLEPGKDFEIVTVSFDPRDTPATASAKKAVYLDRYKRPGAAAGWHFLTADPASIEALTTAAGFRYVWDDPTKQFAHPTGVIVLTSEGRLARYLFGIEYGPRDLRLALVEASAGKVGTPVDALLLYCYHYNPMTGRYGLVIMRAMRIAGATTVLALGAFIFLMVRREKHHSPGTAPSTAAPGTAPGTRHPARGTRLRSSDPSGASTGQAP
jgi:protein SCO1/2